jgi:hypothetical protein
MMYSKDSSSGRSSYRNNHSWFMRSTSQRLFEVRSIDWLRKSLQRMLVQTPMAYLPITKRSSSENQLEGTTTLMSPLYHTPMAVDDELQVGAEEITYSTRSLPPSTPPRRPYYSAFEHDSPSTSSHRSRSSTNPPSLISAAGSGNYDPWISQVYDIL